MEPYINYRFSRHLEFPLVVSVPHSGIRIPEERHDLMMLSNEVFLRDIDFEIHQMWEETCLIKDISYIKSEVHRYAIDLNRRTDQLDSYSIKSSLYPRTPEEKHNPKGLIWTQSTLGESLGQNGRPFEPVDEVIVKLLIDKIWTPYYSFIEKELQRVREKFGFAILIDGHSMPSKGTSFHADPGGARAHIVPGNNKGKSCSIHLMNIATELAHKEGFTVSPNNPYSGGNITQYFGRPLEKLHALQIEVNRALYVDNESAAKKTVIDSGMSRLKSLASNLVSALKNQNLEA